MSFGLGNARAMQRACPTVSRLQTLRGRAREEDSSKEVGTPPAQLDDLRFVALLGAQAWSQLPQSVRRRFSKRLGPGDVALYRGVVTCMTMTRAGWLLAQALRVIGGPLPVSLTALGPAVVAVTEDAALGGQAWIRTYSRVGRFPQVVHSAKRFCGPTGLEEYVGYGIGMTLRVFVDGEALVFRSERYYVELGPLRLYLPPFLTPGVMCVRHCQESDDTFSFHLTLTHSVLGVLLDQFALFSDVGV